MSDQHDPQQPYSGQQQPGYNPTPQPQQPYGGYSPTPQSQPFQSPQPGYNQQPAQPPNQPNYNQPNYNQPTYPNQPNYPNQPPYQQGQNPQPAYNNATPYYSQQPKKKGGFPIWILFVLIPVIIIGIVAVLFITLFNGAKTAVTDLATTSAQTISVASTSISSDVNGALTNAPTLALGLPTITPRITVAANGTTAPVSKATTAPASKATTAPASKATTAPTNSNPPANVAFPAFPSVTEVNFGDEYNKILTEQFDKEAPGSAMKIYVSDKTVADLAADIDKAMTSAGYASSLPGMSGMMGSGDSYIGYYAKAGAPDMFLVLGDPKTASSGGGSSVDDQLAGKKSLLYAFASPSTTKP